MARVLEHAGRYLYALGAGVVLYTAGPFVPRHRRMLSQVARHFGYRPIGAPPELLPEVGLEEVVPAETDFRLLEAEERDGNVTLYELVAIAKVARAARPFVSFEIGTFNGRTTLNLAANAPDGAVVHTLDLPAEGLDAAGLPLEAADVKYVLKQRSGELFAGTPQEAMIRQHFGDSARFDFGPWRGAVDLVFVDGAHSYEYVMSDSARALELLRDGRGTILWHDYGAWEGVTRALNELRAKGGPWAGMKHIRGTTVAYLRLG